MPSSGLIDLEGFQNDFIRLPSKPSARLSYSFRPQSQGETGSGQPQRLLIFLSGIDNRSKSWQAAIASFIRLSQIRRLSIPPILIYDRYGIGLSDRHPSETDKHSKLRYSILEAMYDLHELVVQIALEKLGYKEAEVHRLNIVFASHSMGCFIARLYAQEYLGTVEALLLIDSGISNTAVQDFVPDPDRPTHVYKYNVPSDVTPDMCRLAIQRIMKSPFNFYGRNREGMYWGNSPELLPHNDAPRLRGPRSGLPLVTVVVNDPEVMNKSFAKILRVPEVIVRSTLGLGQHDYCRGLVHIQGQGTGKGPLVASGCGHHVHIEGPDFVARELVDLIIRVSESHVQSRI